MEFLIIEESIILVPEQGMCPAQNIKDDRVVYNSNMAYRIQQFQNYVKFFCLEHKYFPPRYLYGKVRIQNNRGDLIGEYTTKLANETRLPQIEGEFKLEDIRFIRNYGHRFLQVQGNYYLYTGTTDQFGLRIKGVDEETGEEETRYVGVDSKEDDYMIVKAVIDETNTDHVEGFFSHYHDHLTASIDRIVLDKPFGETDNWGRRRSRNLKPLAVVGIFGEFIPVDSTVIS